MKRVKKFLQIVFLVCTAGILLYTAFETEQQKQQAAAAGMAAELAAAEEARNEVAKRAEAVMKARLEQDRLEKERKEAELAKLLANPAYDKEIDIAKLRETVNQDIYAWVYIPDSNIDYPVLQHPTDNTYYLNYNIDGSKGYPGCIYSENYNSRDFSDPVTVLYGHNMKNGSMFAGLHKFKDIAYFESHPHIYIYTESEILEYDIFGAYEYNAYHILLEHNFDSSEVFREYLEKVYSHQGNFKETVFTEKSRVLTLSTCVANNGSKRYLVQAVLDKKYDYPE